MNNFALILTLLIISLILPVSADLACLLPLNETAGTFAEDNGPYNNHNATLYNGLSFDSGSVPGRHGGALTFNGTTHYALIDTSLFVTLPGVQGTGSDFTVMFWVKIPAWQDAVIAACKLNDIEWTVGVTSGQQVSVGLRMPPDNIKNGYQVDGSSLPLDEFFHVAAVFSDALKAPSAVYINGQLAASVGIGSWAAFSTPGMMLGGRQRDATIPDRPLLGAIDDFAVFDAPLDTTTIQAIYNSNMSVRDYLNSDIFARIPEPADNAVYVQRMPTLKWRPGENADCHHLYFGTDYSAVNNAADPETAPGMGVMQSPSFKPGKLQNDTTYYWRVDACYGPEIVRGSVWSFNVADYPAGELTAHLLENYLYVDPKPLSVMRHAQNAGLISYDDVILPEGDNLVGENEHFGWPVAEMIDDTIGLFYTREPGHGGSGDYSGACFIYSDDVGISWSEMLWLVPLMPTDGWLGDSLGPSKGGMHSIGVNADREFVIKNVGTLISADKGRTWTHFVNAMLGLTNDHAHFGPSMCRHPDFGMLLFNGEDTDPAIQYAPMRRSLDGGRTFADFFWPSVPGRPVEPESLVFGDGHILLISREYDTSVGASDGRYYMHSQHVYKHQPGNTAVDINQFVSQRTNVRGNLYGTLGTNETAGLSFNPVTNRIELLHSHRYGGGLGDTGDNELYRKNSLNLWSIDPDELLAGSSRWRFEGTLLERNDISAKGYQDGMHPGSPVVDEVRGREHIFIYAGLRRCPAGIFRISRTLDTPRLSRFLLRKFSTIYNFDATDGLTDAGGYTFNANIIGLPALTAGAAAYGSTGALHFTSGSDKAYNFEDAGDYFDFDADQDFTLEILMRTSSHNSGGSGGAGALVAKDSSLAVTWALTVQDGKIFYTQTDGSRTTQVTSDMIVSDGQWHHAALVRSAADKLLRLYIDHQLDNFTAETTTGELNNSNNICIAATNYHGQQFVGDIDYLRIAREALAPALFLQPVAKRGDVDLSGVIDAEDADILQQNLNRQTDQGNALGDLNHDGVVDADDLDQLNQNLGTGELVAPQAQYLALCLNENSIVETAAALDFWEDLAPRLGSNAAMPDDSSPSIVNETLPNHVRQPVLQFDGIDDELTLGGDMDFDLRRFSWFIVFKPQEANSYQKLLSFAYDDQGDGLPNQDVWGSYIDSDALYSHTCHRSGANVSALLWPAPQQWCILSAVWQSSDFIRQYLNGQLAGQFDGPISGDPFIHLHTSIGAAFNGIIAEILIYDSPLNDQQRQQVETYLGYKYGIWTAGMLPCDSFPDHFIDLNDYTVFARNWLYSDCSLANNWCDRSDLNQNAVVDIDDLRLFYADWLGY